MAKKKLGQILIEMGYVTREEVESALESQPGSGGKKIGEILVEDKACDEEQVAKALAHQSGLKYCQISKHRIPPEVIGTVPREVAVEHTICPLKKGKRALIVASENPLDFFALDNLRFQLGAEVECVIASRVEIVAAINQYYGEVLGIDEALEAVGGDEIDVCGGHEEDRDAYDDDDDAPIVRLANQIIAEAVKKGASDIHIEPMERKVRLRYRVDGRCAEQEPIPKRLQGALLSRFKIMAKMKPEEKRVPQDGRIKMRLGGRDIDFRVNSLPATHGESIVLRILDKEKAMVDLEKLGMHPSDYSKFTKMITRPNGIMLVTGPTGSGKTTTLYAALNKLNRPDVKIITAENPVEYNIEGINQAEVHHEIGRTFAVILKAMLRQAPNVILVGEIRDEETATVGIQAALTGHLVFSTLHTNDAPSSISRLTDMGVKPFLVASAIIAVLAQRLVRRLCSACREELSLRDIKPWQLQAVNLRPEHLRGRRIFGPVGCEKCGGIGYKGRQGVYELMEMTPAIRELAFDGARTSEIRQAAIQSGMNTLQMDGVRKVLEGITTIDEVLRITHRQDLQLA
ncbi:MAG: type II/IV secretion system protein [Planctomycetota bacterium]|nr:MAG: type II/IV secretion system protein [Planctomycetota bacterium]